MIIYNRTQNKIVAGKVEKADDFKTRLKGLIPRSSLEPEEGLWIIPCSMIHTCFMRFSIDAVFLDKSMRVKRIIQNLKPWRLSPRVFQSASVLELGAGKSIGRIEEGDILEGRG